MEVGSDLCLDLLLNPGEVGDFSIPLGPGYSGRHSALPILVILLMWRSENFLLSLGDLMEDRASDWVKWDNTVIRSLIS